MDLNWIYALLITLTVITLSLTVQYLKAKGIIKFTQNDLLNFVVKYQLTMEIIKNLNVPQEKQLNTIDEILDLTFEFLTETLDVSNNQLVSAGTTYAYGLAEKFNIPLTEERMKLIEEVIKIGVDIRI